MSKADLISLISKSYSHFRANDVVKISDLGNLKVLELFHGPTLAFKDIAMQLIGNFYQYHLGRDQKKITANISNNHQQYALTWFSVAISILLLYLYFRKKNY